MPGKGETEMVEKLPQHKHCGVCGRAIPADDEFCNDECTAKHDSLLKKRKTYVYMMYGAIIIMIIFLFLGLVLTG